MFEAENVTLRIGSRTILDTVSAKILPGKLTVIAGPNGAGKSTLLKVLTGEVKPSEGQARFEGEQLARLAPHHMAMRRAVLPQSSRLAFPFTVLEVVRLGVDSRPGLTSAMRRMAPVAALEKVDLGHFGGRLYQELSGGEQQRVHLARVLCQIGGPVAHDKPQYLFLDEPTSSLDIRHQIETLEIAQRFTKEGGGVLAILHDLNLAVTFADHLIVLHGGRVAAEGRPQDIVTADLIKTVFGLDLEIGHHADDARPYVLPRRLAA